MPIPIHRARVAATAVAVVVLGSLAFASIGEAKSIPAELRVVDSDGDILAEQTQYTQTSDTEVKTDKKADCFGPDNVGSGKTALVPGATALSQLLDAQVSDKDVKPVSVSDAFDFGLALCGIGEAVATEEGFLLLKQNHADSESGAEGTTLKKGDSILWYLVEDFNQPTPDELELSVKPTAKPGSDIKVKVVSYDGAGKKTPAEGAKVNDADGLTDAKGVTTVPAESDLVLMQATRKGAIPSNVGEVCTTKLSKCPLGYAGRIGGTKGDDKITATKDAETILAGAGDDKITADQGGAPDQIKCGAGDDTVTISGGSPSKLSGCEKVDEV